ncbi:MAG: hypothetical protein ACYS9X_30005, partial [Planctomycetota bacterium]
MTRSPRSAAAALAAAAVVLVSGGARARDLWESDDGDRSVAFTTTIKATTVMPESDEATNLWRLRLGLSADAPASHAELAYEHRARSSSAAGGVVTGLPLDAPGPFRLAQLDDGIIEEGTYTYRHELDRAFVALRNDRAEVTVGRQAIGWGRGALYGAVDVFSPFAPLEVDREWRRGVDAVRVDVRSSGHGSLDIVLAGEETWDDSALLGRLSGRTDSGAWDGDLVFGKRGEDLMYAGAISASTPGGAAVYGELAFFDTPEDFDNGGLFGSDAAVAKAVVGAWRRYNLGEGLTLRAEYHFSGFGLDDISTLPFQSPDYFARIVRGDMQILGKRAVAFQASYQLSDVWTSGLAVVGNPDDGSGVVTPSLAWDFSDNVSVSFSV